MNGCTKQQIELITTLIIKATDTIVPVDTTKLVEKLGGKIVYTGDRPTLKVDDKSFKIMLPFYGSIIQERFEIAKLLGHLILHLGYFSNYERISLSASQEEQQANYFASSLLIPKAEFRSVLRANSNILTKDVNIAEVARYFNVSKSAVINRGRALDLLYTQ